MYIKDTGYTFEVMGKPITSPTTNYRGNNYCRSLCNRFSINIFAIKRTGRKMEIFYTGGVKYCRKCEIYIKTDEIFCPCCRRKLRLKPKRRGTHEHEKYKKFEGY